VLLLWLTSGSSREFGGWEVYPSSSIVAAILQRACVFLPALAAVTPQQLLPNTRVGLRPYAFGLPTVGPVPGLPGVIVAAGHEGSGLTQGPATADLVVHQLLGRQESLDRELLEAAGQLQPQLRLSEQSGVRL
jgi:glycine/D-amino acid oxidase-like deaminating enzyme